MTDSFDWDALYFEYVDYWAAALAARTLPKEFDPPAVAVQRLTNPTDTDRQWLTEALQEEEGWPTSGKRFVGLLAGRAISLAEIFFLPLLDAAIDEVDPSSNRILRRTLHRQFRTASPSLPSRRCRSQAKDHRRRHHLFRAGTSFCTREESIARRYGPSRRSRSRTNPSVWPGGAVLELARSTP